MDQNAFITLTLNNHPGVISQVSGLLHRRGADLVGLWSPAATGERRTLTVQINPHGRLDQILAQLEKLYDVFSLKVSSDEASALVMY